VIFFGLLGSHANAVSDELAPGLQANLQRAGLPAPVASQVAAGFRSCFHDRSGARDPSAVPASCRQAQAQGGRLGPDAGGRVGATVAATADTARRQNFSDSIQRTLLFEVAVFLLCLLLILLLPAVSGRALAQRPDQAPAAA
jgi:hypothetical protein